MLTEPREALYTLIAAAQPAQIDLATVIEGNPVPLQTKGIYTLQDDVLTYCVAPPGRPRPAEFATKQGDGHTLVTLKRMGAREMLDRWISSPSGGRGPGPSQELRSRTE